MSTYTEQDLVAWKPAVPWANWLMDRGGREDHPIQNIKQDNVCPWRHLGIFIVFLRFVVWFLFHLPLQLSVYNAPPLKSKYVDEKPGRLQSGFSSVRKSASYYINGCKVRDCKLSNWSGMAISELLNKSELLGNTKGFYRLNRIYIVQLFPVSFNLKRVHVGQTFWNISENPKRKKKNCLNTDSLEFKTSFNLFCTLCR